MHKWYLQRRSAQRGHLQFVETWTQSSACAVFRCRNSCLERRWQSLLHYFVRLKQAEHQSVSYKRATATKEYNRGLPRESCNSRVSLLSRYGTLADPELSAVTTELSTNSDVLMLELSVIRMPLFSVWRLSSLPARSIKCNLLVSVCPRKSTTVICCSSGLIGAPLS